MSDEKPITNEDLYGKSEPVPSQVSDTPNVVPPVSTLPIEETPEIIEDVASSSGDQSHQAQVQSEQDAPKLSEPKKIASPQNKKKSGCVNVIGTIIVFLGLFAIGIWLSSFVRQFLQPSTSEIANEANTTPTKSLTPTVPTRPTVSSNPYATWKTYDVISGVSKTAIPGIQIKLPSDVLAPICDGAGCSSQGTYLPGGTRLTIAPRGTGQVLRDFRGTVISDVNGTPFTTKKITIAGLPATEYSGGFGGKTISGYAFNKMRGVMIELTDKTSLELNHFTPSGITSDFAKDDILFDEILKNIVINGNSGSKGEVIPTPTRASTSSATVTPTKVATSSGY